MVTVTLKHVHQVTARLKTGRTVKYFYAWKGKGAPRLEGEPGSAEFVRSYQAAYAARKTPATGDVRELVTAFRLSPEFHRIGAHTKRAYYRHLDQIVAEFGEMPLSALEIPRVRRHFIAWRNTMADTPRTADYAISTLKRLLSWGVENVLIASNQAQPIGRLHRVDRSEAIWTDDDLQRLAAVASEEVMWAVRLALHTGLRQGDLIRLTWSHYDGASFSLRTSKRRKTVLIPATVACRELMAVIPKRQLTVLTTERTRRPWTADGLRSSFGKACKTAKVDRTFHDLRRTAATNLLRAGLDASSVAMVMGWEERAIEALKRKYVSRALVTAAVVAKLGG